MLRLPPLFLPSLVIRRSLTRGERPSEGRPFSWHVGEGRQGPSDELARLVPTQPFSQSCTARSLLNVEPQWMVRAARTHSVELWGMLRPC